MFQTTRLGFALAASAALCVAGLAVAEPVVTAANTREDPALEMRTVRFWTGSQGRTEILAMVGVPYLLAAPSGTGPTARITYQVRMRVVDSKGVELALDTVTRRAPASFRKEGAIGQEQLNFLVAPGQYYLTVTVSDSVSGRIITDSIPFTGYAEAPLSSDLLLVSTMRIATDTLVAPGEMSRGDYRMVASSETRIDLTRPSVAFLLEAYSAKPAVAELKIRLTTIAGEPLVKVAPRSYNVPAKGMIIAQEIPLEGIPQGRYIVDAELAMNGKTTHHEATFTVTDPEAALQRQVAERRFALRTDQGYFSQVPADSLDALYEVLTLRGKNSALSAWNKNLDEAAKRQFLINYWTAENPNKNPEAENPIRMQFYAAVDQVNKAYNERSVPGWKTDRGRLRIKYGAPDDSLYYNGGQGAPILMWKWVRAQPAWAVLADRSRTGAYVLMKFSNDDEPGNPDWIRIVTGATVASQVEPFVGQKFVQEVLRMSADSLDLRR